MNNISISIINNKILSDILIEVNSFHKKKIIDLENFKNLFSLIEKNNELCHNNVVIASQKLEKDVLEKLKKNFLPVILLTKESDKINKIEKFYIETINVPFKINELLSKVQICFSKCQFNKKSFFNISNYNLDLNKREITNNKNKLKLTEKEINFIIYLSQKNRPTKIDMLLHDVWKYSAKTETHTIETHVHRLRKKIFNVFGDKNFIKNNKNGYYI